MPEIRIKEGMPVAADFVGYAGTPIVIDTTTGLGYSLTRANEVKPIAASTGGGVTDGNKGDVVVSGDTWTLASTVMSTAGRAFCSAEDSAAQRTAMGLGTAATQPVGDFATSSHAHDATYSAIAHGHSSATSGVAGFMAATDKSKLDGVASGATANATDAALRDRSTHTGTQSADTIIDGATNHVFTAADDTKLAGVATGATANSADATLLARANHTGTQLAATISDFAAAVAALGLGSDPWAWTKLAANSTVSTTAFAVVAGMSFTGLSLTTYLVELVGAYQTAATTTGIGLALDVPAGSSVIGINQVATSATAAGAAEQIADATTTGATTGVRAANTNTPITARWVVTIGATPGTVQLMQRSEIAASNTVLQANLTIMGRRVI